MTAVSVCLKKERYSGISGIKTAVAVVGRSRSRTLPEGSAEGALGIPSGLNGDILDGIFGGPEKKFSICKSCIDNILVRSVSGFLAEHSGEIKRTDRSMLREVVDRDRVAEMLIDISYGRSDRFTDRYVLLDLGGIAQDRVQDRCDLRRDPGLVNRTRQPETFIDIHQMQERR